MGNEYSTVANCELPWIEASVGATELEERGRSTTEVAVTIGPAPQVGTYETTVAIQTNDPDNATVQVPLTVEVLSPKPPGRAASSSAL